MRGRAWSRRTLSACSPSTGRGSPTFASERSVALYHTRDHTLVAVDSWDPKNKNPHTAFLGAPRVGKTFTAQYQFTETLRDEDVDGVVIDVGLNWKRTVEHYGGPVVRVDTSGRTSKNPLRFAAGAARAY